MSCVSGRGHAELAQLLEESYSIVTTALAGRPEADFFKPSRCAGWAVQDVLFHQLLDVRRALRTFVSPAEGEPDVDDITYWEAFAGGADTGDDDAARHARFVRVAASPYQPDMLMWEWRETTSAAALRWKPLSDYSSKSVLSPHLPRGSSASDVFSSFVSSHKRSLLKKVPTKLIIEERCCASYSLNNLSISTRKKFCV